MRTVLTLLLAVTSYGVLAQDRYRVEFDDSLHAVRVRACFDGSPPARLYHNAQAGRFAGPVTVPGGQFKLRDGAESTPLPPLEPDSCLEWETDLEEAADGKDFRHAMRIGADIVTDGDLWFLRGPGERDLLVEVALPEGMSISTPWHHLGRRGAFETFKPAATPATWAYRIAVGTFAIESLKVDGAEIRLAVPGSPAASDHEKLSRWISRAASAVGSIYGSYPQDSAQVLVVPIGSRNEPVPWAHVMRGGGVSAEFFVDESRSLEELNADWTACHELSHMLLPFVSSRDRWLSEGLASYYQYLLLARSGELDEQDAWQGLYDGFGRGRADRGGGTLAEATGEGWKHTMRVYWSGAAMMFLADVRLRTLSDGRQSLDTALAELQTCCIDNTRRWRARELFQQLDRITGTGVFASLYREHVNSSRFPELSGTWAALGIRTQPGRVRLDDDATSARLRTTIMSPVPQSHGVRFPASETP